MLGGIADYAAILGAALDERGISQTYIVGGHAASEHRTRICANFPSAVVLDCLSPRDLLRSLAALEAKTLIVHYSGYGYAPRGGPLWLAEGLEQWKNLRKCLRLIVMFHETWASGLPWQSSFWVSWIQRYCVARIARLADAVVTNTSFYRSRLQPFVRHDTEIQTQPIFSNVGEPEHVPPFEERDPICVLFGRGGTRRRTYERFRPHFERLRMLGTERLIEIGSEPELCLARQCEATWLPIITRQ
jgi:hypothetical protein